jgi:hypothetical protein
MKSALLSDVGSHRGVRADMDEGSHTQSYFFGTSTMMINRIRGMIDNGYFDKGIGHEPEEETALELQSDEDVVFE